MKKIFIILGLILIIFSVFKMCSKDSSVEEGEEVTLEAEDLPRREVEKIELKVDKKKDNVATKKTESSFIPEKAKNEEVVAEDKKKNPDEKVKDDLKKLDELSDRCESSFSQFDMEDGELNIPLEDSMEPHLFSLREYFGSYIKFLEKSQGFRKNLVEIEQEQTYKQGTNNYVNYEDRCSSFKFFEFSDSLLRKVLTKAKTNEAFKEFAYDYFYSLSQLISMGSSMDMKLVIGLFKEFHDEGLIQVESIDKVMEQLDRLQNFDMEKIRKYEQIDNINYKDQLSDIKEQMKLEDSVRRYFENNLIDFEIGPPKKPNPAGVVEPTYR